MSETPTFAPLKSRALIALSGPDWRDFLQGLITQDVDTLAVGEARFGALLTPQGRLLHDLFVVGRPISEEGDGCWIDVLAEHRAAIVQRLAMYRLRAKVEITADETPVSIAPFSPPLIPREGGDPSGLAASPNSAWIPAFAGTSGFVRDPRLPALGWRGYGRSPPGRKRNSRRRSAARDAAKLRNWASRGRRTGGPTRPIPIGAANFDLLERHRLQEGLFWWVRETTSRMKRRGQIKSRMLPITFDGPAPSAGAEVLAGDLRAGEVLSVGAGRAMALLRLDRAEGKSLTVEGRPVAVERPAWFLEALGVEAA